MGMNRLITGGCGFPGRNLFHALLAEGEHGGWRKPLNGS